MTVVSMAEAAQRLAPLKGQVTEVRGRPSDLADKPAVELRFADGDEVVITYRDQSRVVSFGKTTRAIVAGLCRDLKVTRADLVAVASEEPRAWDDAWIHVHVAGQAPGRKLAFVRGISAVQLNIVLGRAIARVEHTHKEGRVHALFSPTMTAETAEPVEPSDLSGDDDQ